eukprot:8456778-Karenia_brevis.AAC.1
MSVRTGPVTKPCALRAGDLVLHTNMFSMGTGMVDNGCSEPLPEEDVQSIEFSHAEAVVILGCKMSHIADPFSSV